MVMSKFTLLSVYILLLLHVLSLVCPNQVVSMIVATCMWIHFPVTWLSCNILLCFHLPIDWGSQERCTEQGPTDPIPGATDQRQGPADPRQGPADPRQGPADPRQGPGFASCPATGIFLTVVQCFIVWFRLQIIQFNICTVLNTHCQ